MLPNQLTDYHTAVRETSLDKPYSFKDGMMPEGFMFMYICHHDASMQPKLPMLIIWLIIHQNKTFIVLDATPAAIT